MKTAAVIFAACVAGLTGLFGGVAAFLFIPSAPDPQWVTKIQMRGGIAIEPRVAPLLRAATSPAGRFLLNGRRLCCSHGEFRFEDSGGALLVVCVQCVLRDARLSSRPIDLRDARLLLRREGESVSATLTSGALTLHFAGQLRENGILLGWTLPPIDAGAALAILHEAIPDLVRAQIRGRVAASGSLDLPSGRVTMAPQIYGLEVVGLGTEALRYGAFRHLCRRGAESARSRVSGDLGEGWLAGANLGPWIGRAVIAAEDARFYQHPGFDLIEIAHAQDRRETQMLRGASTLTQQLAKNLHTGAEPTVARKVRELLYAVEMERTLGKQRILTLYLNTVAWGPGICGAGEASKHYFGKTPATLTIPEAAWLAGILRNPQRAYDLEVAAGRIDETRLAWVIDNMQLPLKIRQRARATPVFANRFDQAQAALAGNKEQ